MIDAFPPSDIRRVAARPGASCAGALREALETGQARAWAEGFLLDLHKMRLTIDSCDCALWAKAGADEAERAICLETVLFKALCARFSVGGAAAGASAYWLPVANAPDLRVFPFDSPARRKLLEAAHDDLEPRTLDALLQQIETDYFDHILSTILPGVIEDPERHALAAGPVFVLSERVFGSAEVGGRYLTPERRAQAATVLEDLDLALEKNAQAGTPLLDDIKSQVVTMRWSLIEAQALAQGAFRASTPSTPGGPQLH